MFLLNICRMRLQGWHSQINGPFLSHYCYRPESGRGSTHGYTCSLPTEWPVFFQISVSIRARTHADITKKRSILLDYKGIGLHCSFCKMLVCFNSRILQYDSCGQFVSQTKDECTSYQKSTKKYSKINRNGVSSKCSNCRLGTGDVITKLICG
jgi:hypothetical protein